jgi:hypothetical protein
MGPMAGPAICPNRAKISPNSNDNTMPVTTPTLATFLPCTISEIVALSNSSPSVIKFGDAAAAKPSVNAEAGTYALVSHAASAVGYAARIRPSDLQTHDSDDTR